MNYKCLSKFEARLEQAVEDIIEEGTAQTADGKWRLPLDGLAGRCGASYGCPTQLIRDMLAERKEILGIEEEQGLLRIDFDPEYCVFTQRALFDPERMRTTAVYTLEEADGPHYFYSEHAGGYSLAFQVSKRLAAARDGIAAEVSNAELMPLLVSDYHFLEEQVRLFTPVPEAEAQRYLTDVGRTAFHVTLDFSEDTVRVENLPGAAECSLPALTLKLHGRGFTCDSLYGIASGPEACFASEENTEMDMSKLHEKVFRQTILHNLEAFVERSAGLEGRQNQSGMTLT